ncbi:MAG: hypothetical protein ACM31C_14335, partial [Acidobacteriota bacterium]
MAVTVAVAVAVTVTVTVTLTVAVTVTVTVTVMRGDAFDAGVEVPHLRAVADDAVELAGVEEFALER